jgi:hypothetical protein
MVTSLRLKATTSLHFKINARPEPVKIQVSLNSKERAEIISAPFCNYSGPSAAKVVLRLIVMSHVKHDCGLGDLDGQYLFLIDCKLVRNFTTRDDVLTSPLTHSTTSKSGT